jgi:hypothetical protein
MEIDDRRRAAADPDLLARRLAERPRGAGSEQSRGHAGRCLQKLAPTVHRTPRFVAEETF